VNYLESLVLGLIQGATEFLPVSSSGHLVVGQLLMGIRLPGVGFEVALHVATLLSVILVYRKRLAALTVGALKAQGEAWRFLGLLFLATLPAAVVGLGAGDFIESLFDAPAVAGFALLITGSFLWTTRRALARSLNQRPGVRIALLMGVAQAFAIVPGISRSGATVVAGLWLGVEAEEAAEFSFLMAIPAILGAAVLQLPDVMEGGLGMEAGPLMVGSAAAGIMGILAIRTFITMLRKKSFYHFAPYCWGVGVLFLLYLAMGG
jgi:undecaprenyl-diphosphatase